MLDLLPAHTCYYSCGARAEEGNAPHYFLFHYLPQLPSVLNPSEIRKVRQLVLSVVYFSEVMAILCRRRMKMIKKVVDGVVMRRQPEISLDCELSPLPGFFFSSCIDPGLHCHRKRPLSSFMSMLSRRIPLLRKLLRKISSICSTLDMIGMISSDLRIHIPASLLRFASTHYLHSIVFFHH